MPARPVRAPSLLDPPKPIAKVPQAEAEHRQLSAALARAEGRTEDATAFAAEASDRFTANSQHLRGAIAARVAGRTDKEGVFRERVIAAPDRWAKAFAPAFSLELGWPVSGHPVAVSVAGPPEARR